MAAIPSSMPAAVLVRPKPKLSYRKSLFSSIAAALILCGLWAIFGSLLVPMAIRVDFLTIYTEARMAAKGEYGRLHDPVLMERRMREIDPEPTAGPVVRPHFYGFLISPLARLSYHTAFWVWMGIQMSLLFACWIWAVVRFGPDALIWGALSVPCCLGIAHGQDCVLMLAIAIGGYALAKKKFYWAAGAVLALALMKFHLILFLAPAMLLSRRWKMFGGFAGMAAALVGWCYLLGGAQGLETYAALLRNKDLEKLNPAPDLMISIQGLLANLHADFEVLRVVLGLLALIVAGLVLTERQPLWRWMSLAITASLFAAPHVYGYDAAIMVLPIWLVQAYSRKTATRTVFAAFATPLPFLAGLAGQPWSIITPLCLGACFGTLTWEAWISRRNRDQAESQLLSADEFILAQPVL
jgi:hypothetical protein